MVFINICNIITVMEKKKRRKIMYRYQFRYGNNIYYDFFFNTVG